MDDRFLCSSRRIRPRFLESTAFPNLTFPNSRPVRTGKATSDSRRLSGMVDELERLPGGEDSLRPE
jgi:hypothetical protein